MANNNSMVSVPVKDINFASYQRPVRKDTVMKIVDNFDIHRMRPVELSFRDGRLWCFDGQHRVFAYKKMDMVKIPAQVHYGLTYEDEAVLFAKQHENERRVSIRDRWNAASAAGEKMPEFIEIKKIFEDRGYEISPHWACRANVFTCLSSVVKGYNAYGANCLKKAVDVIDAAWHECDKRTDADILNALLKIYGTYNDCIDWDRLVTCLQKHTPSSFIRDSMEERGKGSTRVARHMVNIYNVKLRTNKLNIELIRG